MRYTMNEPFLNIDDVNKTTHDFSRQIMSGLMNALYRTLPCRYVNETDVVLNVEERLKPIMFNMIKENLVEDNGLEFSQRIGCFHGAVKCFLETKILATNHEKNLDLSLGDYNKAFHPLFDLYNNQMAPLRARTQTMIMHCKKEMDYSDGLGTDFGKTLSQNLLERRERKQRHDKELQAIEKEFEEKRQKITVNFSGHEDTLFDTFVVVLKDIDKKSKEYMEEIIRYKNQTNPLISKDSLELHKTKTASLEHNIEELSFSGELGKRTSP